MNRIGFGRGLVVGLLGWVLLTGAGASSPSAVVELDTGTYVGLASAKRWSFRLRGVAPGQRYAYRIAGRGREPVEGRGVVANDPHEQRVDLGPFRRGEIRVRVRLLDADGRPTATLTGTVWKDPAYPAGYL